MTKSNYTPEIKERAVRLLLKSVKDHPSTWAAITATFGGDVKRKARPKIAMRHQGAEQP